MNEFERLYRSDFAGKLQWYVHHRPTTIAVIVLAVFLPLGWWLTGDFSPFQIIRAVGGF